MKLMTERRTRRLPVKDGDRLIGVISIGDVATVRNLTPAEHGTLLFGISIRQALLNLR